MCIRTYIHVYTTQFTYTSYIYTILKKTHTGGSCSPSRPCSTWGSTPSARASSCPSTRPSSVRFLLPSCLLADPGPEPQSTIYKTRHNQSPLPGIFRPQPRTPINIIHSYTAALGPETHAQVRRALRSMLAEAAVEGEVRKHIHIIHYFPCFGGVCICTTGSQKQKK